MTIKNDLLAVKDWAQSKINAGQEPPWAWYQYMKLIETTEAILASMGAVKTESSPQSGQRRETLLQPVDSKYQPDDAQCHPDLAADIRAVFAIGQGPGDSLVDANGARKLYYWRRRKLLDDRARF